MKCDRICLLQTLSIYSDRTRKFFICFFYKMNLVFIAVQYVVFCVFLYRIWFWFLVFFCIDFFSTPLVLWNLYFLPSLPLFLGRMPETNTHSFLFFICSTEAAQINPLAISLDLSCSMLFALQIINMFSTYFQIPDSFFPILSPLHLQLRLVVQSGCATYLDIARTCVQSHLQ